MFLTTYLGIYRRKKPNRVRFGVPKSTATARRGGEPVESRAYMSSPSMNRNVKPIESINVVVRKEFPETFIFENLNNEIGFVRYVFFLILLNEFDLFMSLI